MIYPLRCACGFCGEVVAHSSAVADDGTLECPMCGGRAAQDYEVKVRTVVSSVRTKEVVDGMTKNTSLVHYFDPRDAKGIAELMGPEGKYIQRDGTVQFKTKKESKAFNQKWKSLCQRAADKGDKKMAKVLETKTKAKNKPSVV